MARVLSDLHLHRIWIVMDSEAMARGGFGDTDAAAKAGGGGTDAVGRMRSITLLARPPPREPRGAKRQDVEIGRATLSVTPRAHPTEQQNQLATATGATEGRRKGTRKRQLPKTPAQRKANGTLAIQDDQVPVRTASDVSTASQASALAGLDGVPLPPKKCEYQRHSKTHGKVVMLCPHTIPRASFKWGHHFCQAHECELAGCFECKRSAALLCAKHANTEGTIRLMLSEQTPDQSSESPSLKAKQLQTALSSVNISLVLVAMKPGMDVNEDVIAKMHDCVGLVAFCTYKYGSEEGYPVCSNFVLRFWQENFPNRLIIPVTMLKKGEGFLPPAQALVHSGRHRIISPWTNQLEVANKVAATAHAAINPTGAHVVEEPDANLHESIMPVLQPDSEPEPPPRPCETQQTHTQSSADQSVSPHETTQQSVELSREEQAGTPVSLRPQAIALQTRLSVFERHLDTHSVSAIDTQPPSGWMAMVEDVKLFLEAQIVIAMESIDILEAKASNFGDGDSQRMYTAIMSDLRNDPYFNSHFAKVQELAARVEERVRGQTQDSDTICRWQEVPRKAPVPLQRQKDVFHIQAAGSSVLPRFSAFVKQLAENSSCTFSVGKRKKMWRCFEKLGICKTASLGDGSKLVDVVRGTVEGSFEAASSFMDYFMGCDEHETDSPYRSAGFAKQHGHIVIVGVKNKWYTPTTGGWCCGQLYFYFATDPAQHICELQVVHTRMQIARKGVPNQSYAAYTQARSFEELLSVVTPDHADGDVPDQSSYIDVGQPKMPAVASAGSEYYHFLAPDHADADVYDPETFGPTCDSEILKSGWLEKRGGSNKAFKLRWFELTAIALCYYGKKPKEAGKHKHKPKGVILIKDVTGVCITSSPKDKAFNSFKILDESTPTREYEITWKEAHDPIHTPGAPTSQYKCGCAQCWVKDLGKAAQLQSKFRYIKGIHPATKCEETYPVPNHIWGAYDSEGNAAVGAPRFKTSPLKNTLN